MRLTQWLTGWAHWQVQNPEASTRFLNACARAHILIWELRPSAGGKGVSGTVRARDYRRLRPLAHRAGAKLRAGKRGGLPFWMQRLHGRPGLLVGGVAFFLLLGILSQYFWTVEITGCQSISESDLRAALAAQGVAPGHLKRGFYARDVQTTLTKQFPQIAWITVNDRGSDADVRLQEKDAAPKLPNQSGWYSLRAAQSGTVVELRVTAGTAVVKVGEGVLKGQLLVSSVVEDEQEQTQILRHAAGQVIAETHHTLEARAPLTVSTWEPAGELVRRRALELFNARLPLSWTLPPDGDVTRTAVRTSLSIDGHVLPAAILEETLTPVRATQHKRTQKEAEAEALADLSRQEQALGKEVAVTGRKDSVKVDGNEVLITRDATCRENIAVEVPIGGAESEK